jgi:NADPH:quinone reductase-like Zn-dependent oxidoreductase
MSAPGGSYAEYALAWDYTTFHIPAEKSFEGTSFLLPP